MPTDNDTLTLLRAIRGDLALLRERLEDQNRRLGLLEMRVMDLGEAIRQATTPKQD